MLEMNGAKTIIQTSYICNLGFSIILVQGLIFLYRSLYIVISGSKDVFSTVIITFSNSSEISIQNKKSLLFSTPDR